MDLPEIMNNKVKRFIKEDGRFTNKTECIRFIIGNFFVKNKIK